VHLHSVYRVQRLAGALSATFGGLTDPPCADFDSCGVSGSSRWALDTTRGTIAFDAYARAKRSDRGLRGAFAALRRGRGLVFGDGGAAHVFGTTTADVSRPGGTPCHDTARVASPGIDVYTRVRGHVGLDFGGDTSIRADRDLTRAGCPGPRDEDILAPAIVAEGSLPAAAFAERTVTAPLRLQERFKGHGYAGSVRSDFTLELRRISARAQYRRVRGGV
jgi:hypothetical protein